jgi:hypothetical protein
MDYLLEIVCIKTKFKIFNKRQMTINIYHKHHALGDQMHIFSLIWAIKDNYKSINLYINYDIVCHFRGRSYEKYIHTFINALYSKISNVTLYHQLQQKPPLPKNILSKFDLAELVKRNVSLPNLFELDIIPKIDKFVCDREFIVIPMRIRYPPKSFNMNLFFDVLSKLSVRYKIVLIGEQKLDKENDEIFTIYNKIIPFLVSNQIDFIDLTSPNYLYRGDENIDHLWSDLNIIRNAKFVLTFGVSGFIDICSFIGKVITLDSDYKEPFAKLIWNNTNHSNLIKINLQNEILFLL